MNKKLLGALALLIPFSASADIIGVTADPERDITTLQDVRFVMFGGEVVVDKRIQSSAAGEC